MSEHKNSVYRRISLDLKEKIQNGVYPVGTKLPPERQLMSEYQVERLTVRRALDVLARERLITKKSGLGSFVADPNAYFSVTQPSESTQKVSESVNGAGKLIKLTVKPDFAAAAAMIIDFVTSLGHERVAVVSSHAAVFTAFAGTFAAKGTFRPEDFHFIDAEIQAGDVFEAYWRSCRNGYPSTVVASTVKEAALIEASAARLGIAVPEKLSIIAANTDGKRYTGCLFATEAVKQHCSGIGWNEPDTLLPECRIQVLPSLYKGATTAPKSEASRGRAMSDYLL